jgi:hypothetical protein
MDPKNRRGNYTIFNEELQSQISEKRQSGSLHSNKRNNASKGNNNILLLMSVHPTSLNKHLTAQKSPNTMTVENFNMPLSSIDRASTPKKIFLKTSELHNTIDQMDLTEIFRVFHPQQYNTHHSQQPMELSLKQTTFQYTKQFLANIKKLK